VGYHNQYNRKENTILISLSGANAGYVSMYDTKVWASECFSVVPKSNLENKFLYYYLISIQQQIYDLCRKSGHICSKDIASYNIKIPSKSDQERIIKEMEKDDVLEKNLKKNISEMNIRIKKRFEYYLTQCNQNANKDDEQNNNDTDEQAEQEYESDEEEIKPVKTQLSIKKSKEVITKKNNSLFDKPDENVNGIKKTVKKINKEKSNKIIQKTKIIVKGKPKI